MRWSPFLLGRSWYLLAPVVLGLAYLRIEDVKTAHQAIWDLRHRYFSTQQELRQIRTEAMSRVKTERKISTP